MAPHDHWTKGRPPSPAGEGGSREARDGWGPRRREVSLAVARYLRKNLTSHEARLWVRLKEFKAQGLHFRKQVPIGRYVADFACLRVKVIVEVDGEQHGLANGQRRDSVRDRRLEELGYRVLRFWNHEIAHEMNMVLETVFVACAQRLPHPSAASRLPPSPAGEGEARDGSGLPIRNDRT